MNSGDLPAALAELRARAERGDGEAQYEMGWRHALGQGLPEDEAAGLVWLRQAADNGHLLAQNNLGARYYGGEGVEQDRIEAYKWFELAARQGDRKASKNRDMVAAQLTEAERAEAEQRIKQFESRDHGAI